MDRMPNRRAPIAFTLMCASALSLAPSLARANDEQQPGPDPQEIERLARSSLEDLMQIKVTTVSGVPQSRIATPAAVYVISSEDLRRSGARSIVEALRLVPGMYVGRVNSSSWVAGSRGLTGSSLTSTRYLVLVDGRQVYDPLTSVTFWDTVDLILADVDRIEVIRGPGATLWGANAMNGVINIVTKSSQDTQGTLVQAGVGEQGRAEVDLRQGGRAGADASYRVWAKYARFGAFENAAGDSLNDEWSTLRGGFRYDRATDARTNITVEGEAYTHPRAMESVLIPVAGADRQFEQVTNDNEVAGGDLLFRAMRGFGEPEGWRVRAYYDRTQRETTRFGVERDTVDLDYRRWQHWGSRNDLMWGAEYLWTRDRTADGPVLFLDPADRAWAQANLFVQNTTVLVPDRWFLMLGSKFTWHGFSGYAAQPNLRLWWTPSADQTLWFSVSRPVRFPSRFEEDGRLVFSYFDLGAVSAGTPNGVILPVQLTGDENLRPEKLTSWEVGHRVQFHGPWVFETSLFYNDYTRLIEPIPTIFGPFTDAGSGATWGGEVNFSGQVTSRWRLEGAYSWLHTRIDGPVLPFEEQGSPEHLAQLRSYFELSDTLELNAALYHVDEVPFIGVDAYTRFDLGLSWQATPSLRLDLWGKNLLDENHSEASGAQVPRTLFALATFEFGH
jgi:iron complex outermembrane receptor protein